MIEGIWVFLKAKVRRRRPRTTKGYLKVIRESWGVISQSTIDKIVGQVPSRLVMVEERGGAWLKKPKKRFE